MLALTYGLVHPTFPQSFHFHDYGGDACGGCKTHAAGRCRGLLFRLNLKLLGDVIQEGWRSFTYNLRPFEGIHTPPEDSM